MSTKYITTHMRCYPPMQGPPKHELPSTTGYHPTVERARDYLRSLWGQTPNGVGDKLRMTGFGMTTEVWIEEWEV